MKGTLTLLLVIFLNLTTKAQFISGPAGFSIGSGTSVVIDQLTLTPDNNFTIGESIVELSAIPVTGMPSNSIARVYTINPALSGFAGTVGLYFQNSELNGNQATNLALAYASSPSSTTYTVTTPASVTGNYVSHYFNTPLNFGKITATSESALPVTLTRFEVRQEGSIARIEWTTMSEVNNSHFIVERSTDARTFQTHAIVYPMDYSNGNNAYHIFDETPHKPASYYRLKQVDMDGRVTIFTIRKLLWDTSGPQQVIAYPMPAQNHLQLKFSHHFENHLDFDLYDLKGQNVYSGKLFTKDTVPQITFPDDLLSGSYILRIKGDWFDQSLKIIVAR